MWRGVQEVGKNVATWRMFCHGHPLQGSSLVEEEDMIRHDRIKSDGFEDGSFSWQDDQSMGSYCSGYHDHQ